MKLESMRTAPHRDALRHWDQLVEWIGDRPIALVLDYDGTLTPIVSRPEDATLPETTGSLLDALAERCTVAILSGRDLEDVAAMVGRPGIVYAGSHGYDIRGPEGLRFQHEEAKAASSALKAAEKRVRAAIAGIDGAAIERKRFALAVHYRRVQDAGHADRVRRAVADVAREESDLREMRGKAVVELQPDIDWNKGRALEWLLRALELDPRRTAVLYLGDDTTDEDAFRLLAEREIGVGIRVGDVDEDTHASLRVPDTGAVQDVLRRLLDLAQGRDEQGGDREFDATPWSLVYDRWDPEREPLREALCTLGNGCFATRGAWEESSADGEVHYPGTYLAGGYNRAESEVAGRIVENEDLVNWPNWLCLSFRPEGGDWLDSEAVEILSLSQQLDVRRGVLRRTMKVRDREQRETTLSSIRLVSMRDPQLAAIEWTVTPENWSGDAEIRSALDGSVTNSGVARYRDLNGRHLEVVETRGAGEEGILLVARTTQSSIYMAQAARTRAYRDGEIARCERGMHKDADRVAHHLRLRLERRKPTRVEKVVAVCSSRDHALSDPATQAEKLVGRAGTFAELLEAHQLAWDHLWRRCDLRVEDGRPLQQLIVRLHVFHLLQTVSGNTIDRDVGVPPRGWHGEAYRGHILWDEIFILPFLNLRIPELTRELLMYRYRRLDEARAHAVEAGYRGAMYPWQSGSDGREESQEIHLNPKSGRWVPDDTHLQRHVNSAIAYNVWKYYETTGDLEFLRYYGAEMILEIARFWSSIAEFNSERERYEIRCVVGPDEFHTRCPGSSEPGLRNNAYTNVTAAWVLRCAHKTLEAVGDTRAGELRERLSISDQELEAWDDVSRRMYLPFCEGGCVLSQFEGYEDLEELDWEGLRSKYGDIQRLDRILEAEGDSPNRYKAGKQADVLMLFFLFSSEELSDLFDQMGYEWDPDIIPQCVEYYSNRTSHGSTLSRVVHAWVLARSDRAQSWHLFQSALESDVSDIQGGTTSEGIHLGAMAGTVDLLQRCYTGLVVRKGVLWLNPQLPDELQRLRLRLRFRGDWLCVDMSHDELCIAFDESLGGPARVGYDGEIYELHRGERKVFPRREDHA